MNAKNSTTICDMTKNTSSKPDVESFLNKMRLPKSTVGLETSLRASGRTTRMIFQIIELLSKGSKVILIGHSMRTARPIADSISKYCISLGITNKIVSVESLSILQKTGYSNLRGYHDVEIFIDHFAVEQFIEEYTIQSTNFFGYEYQLELARTHSRFGKNKAPFNGGLRMFYIAIAIFAINLFLEFASDERVVELVKYGVID